MSLHFSDINSVDFVVFTHIHSHSKLLFNVHFERTTCKALFFVTSTKLPVLLKHYIDARVEL